jgi:hypothetical protein
MGDARARRAQRDVQHHQRRRLLVARLVARRKEPMLWNLYGYCLERVGEKEKAIAAMEKGVKKVGGHELLQSNLDALKEGRKMKMLAWGDIWYQFHLEKQGTLIRQQTKAIQGRRKIVRR